MTKQKIIVLERVKRLDNTLLTLLEQLKTHSETSLHRKPRGGGWSAMEVAQHLMASEHLSHAYIRKKLSYDPDLKRAGLPNWVRLQLLQGYLRSPLKYKAPKVVDGSDFSDEIGFWELAKKWKQQRAELKSYLSELDDKWFDKIVYKHPVVGRITLLGMVRFFEDHFERHQKQIFRVLDE